MRYANEMIVEELKNDREFLLEYLHEAIRGLFKVDDFGASCLMIRDIVNATIGFKELSLKLGKSDKALMQMLAKGSNPQALNIIAIINAILDYEGLTIKDFIFEQKAA